MPGFDFKTTKAGFNMRIGSKILSYISESLKRLRLCGAVMFSIIILVGCTATTDPNPTEQRVEAFITDLVVNDENIFEFVTLGQYKGIEFDYFTPEPVRQQDVDEIINMHLSLGADVREITYRSVRQDDIVIIDFEGFHNDIPFRGGSATEFELVIGSRLFIPGFEEQLIGRYPGEEFDIYVTFPDDYDVQMLAGELTRFRINLRAIHGETLPELTDEFVRTYFDLESVEEYIATIRDRLEEESIINAENNNRSQVWMEIVRNATIHKYPIDEIEFRTSRGLVEFQYVAATHGMDLDELIYQLTGMPTDEFIDFEVRPGAFHDVMQDLVLRAVAAAEGITLSDEEFEDGVNRLVSDFGFESREALFAMSGEYAVRIAILSEKVIDFVMAHAVAR